MSTPRQLRSIVLAVAFALTAIAVPPAGAAGWQPDVAQVVNGSAMTEAEFASRWPFVVGIVNARARNQYDGQYCGGTLIDDQHVVTAAHCVTLRTDAVLAPSAIRVVAGTRTLDQRSMGSGASAARRVKELFVHPGFARNDGDGFRNDVAVLRLAAPIAGASPIALVQPGEEALWGNGSGGVSAQVAGWGDTDPDGRGNPDTRFPTDLRAATVPVHADARCASTDDGGYGTTFERSTNLCAGALQSGDTLGTDACQGDSGGPLVVDAPDGSRRLAGITSWGEGCAQRQLGAYSRIAALRDWIESIPGATDGGLAIGGPGGTLSVSMLRRTSSNARSVRLAWSPAGIGTAPERYAIWRRTLVGGETAEVLAGITRGTSFRATAPPTRRSNAYTWVVRPLDSGGSNGPVATLRAGPTPDRIRPGMPRALALVARVRGAVVVRWGSAIDRQSGVDRYQVQRRIVGRTRFATVTVSSSPGRVRIAKLRSGDRVQVRVRAIDRAGNTGRWRTSGYFRPRG